MKEAVMQHHVALAVLAVVLFMGHVASVGYWLGDTWLGKYTWIGVIPFAVLAIYAGVTMAVKDGGTKRGMAIASAVTSGMVLWVLLDSGRWVFF